MSRLHDLLEAQRFYLTGNRQAAAAQLSRAAGDSQINQVILRNLDKAFQPTTYFGDAVIQLVEAEVRRRDR